VPEIELGKMYRDSITKLEGIATSVTDFLYACARVGLQPTKLTGEGKTPETHYFDQHQIEEIKGKITANPPKRDVDDAEIELGAIYRDSITKFEGVAISRTRFMYSSSRVILQSIKMHEGKPVDPQAFDAHSLILVKPAAKSPAKPMPKQVEKTGGPGGTECPPRAVLTRR
jgi:hypothetical protein